MHGTTLSIHVKCMKSKYSEIIIQPCKFMGLYVVRMPMLNGNGYVGPATSDVSLILNKSVS